MTCIVEETAERMWVRTRTRLWLKLLLGLMLVVYVWFLCPSRVLHCRRTGETQVEIRVEERLLGILRSSRVIPGVESAAVETNPKRKRPGAGSMSHGRSSGRTSDRDDTARIVFQTEHGPVPLTSAYLGGQKGFREATEEVNRFVRSAGSSAAVVPVPTDWMIWLWAAFLACFATGVIFSPGTHCEIDRSKEVVRIRRTGLGPRKAVEYPLAKVERFTVIENARRRARRKVEQSRERVEYGVGMRTTAGDEVLVTWWSGALELDAMAELAARLERFRLGKSA